MDKEEREEIIIEGTVERPVPSIPEEVMEQDERDRQIVADREEEPDAPPQEEEYDPEIEDAKANAEEQCAPSENEETPPEETEEDAYKEYYEELDKELLEKEQEYIPSEHTFITAFQQFFEEVTDADPEFIEASALQTFSVFLPDFKIQENVAVGFEKFFDATKNRNIEKGKSLNIWTISFGHSRKARKSTVMNTIRNLILCAQTDFGCRILLAKNTTPQALMALSKGGNVNE